MAPKPNGKEKAIPEDEEEVLQAVILADSFNQRFKPLTINKPRCLLPVCNAPLLEWTFESLALAGVQEIFVICRSHADKVKAAIQESKWSRPGSGIKIIPIITAKEVFSAGDAMRDIYTHGIITSDFVLVSGDLVSNVNIDEVVRIHKERRRTNRDAIMTMVVKESGSVHRTRPRGETSVFVLDAKTQECLHYEAVQGYPPRTHSLIPREILNEHPEVEVRNDFIDCFIDVCSVEVPSLFQDNFDYQDIRRDFVHGVLTSDLLMKNIYCHVVTNEYAARVKDTKTYAAITKDILSRWSYPLVPDNNLPGSSSKGKVDASTVSVAIGGYEHQRSNIYLSLSYPPSLARTASIGPLTLLGPRTLVAPDAQVAGSVLGAGCKVGTGAIVCDSILMDDVVVEGGCVLEGCIVGDGVRVRENSRIKSGSLVADGVMLGPGARLPRFTRVSVRKTDLPDNVDEEYEDSDIEEAEAAQTEEYRTWLGAESNGIVWPAPTEEEGDEDDPIDAIANQRLLRLGDDASGLDLSDNGSITSDSESEESEISPSHLHARFRRHSRTSSQSSAAASLPTPTTTLSAQSDSEREFQGEVHASLARAFAENHAVDDAAVELKTLRMASNVPLGRVREAVVAAIVDHIPLISTDVGSAAAQRAAVSRVITRWGQLIAKIGGQDGAGTLSILQAHCARSPRIGLFGQILSLLYQLDIVEEDDIRTWHSLPSSKAIGSTQLTENTNRLWAIGGRLLQQLDEQEDESDSNSE